MGVSESSKRVQGHTPGGFGGLTVVKDHVPPELTGLPEVSVPVTFAVYFTKPASGALGVKVTVRVEASYAVAPATVAPLASFSVRAAEPAVNGLEYFALTVTLVGVLEESGSGDWFMAMSAELLVEVKLHVDEVVGVLVALASGTVPGWRTDRQPERRSHRPPSERRSPCGPDEKPQLSSA